MPGKIKENVLLPEHMPLATPEHPVPKFVPWY